nr:hypothetical protein [Angustibacter aerolatus]
MMLSDAGSAWGADDVEDADDEPGGIAGGRGAGGGVLTGCGAEHDGERCGAGGGGAPQTACGRAHAGLPDRVDGGRVVHGTCRGRRRCRGHEQST